MEDLSDFQRQRSSAIRLRAELTASKPPAAPANAPTPPVPVEVGGTTETGYIDSVSSSVSSSVSAAYDSAGGALSNAYITVAEKVSGAFEDVGITQRIVGSVSDAAAYTGDRRSRFVFVLLFISNEFSVPRD